VTIVVPFRVEVEGKYLLSLKAAGIGAASDWTWNDLKVAASVAGVSCRVATDGTSMDTCTAFAKVGAGAHTLTVTVEHNSRPRPLHGCGRALLNRAHRRPREERRGIPRKIAAFDSHSACAARTAWHALSSQASTAASTACAHPALPFCASSHRGALSRSSSRQALTTRRATSSLRR
jgi:hypothetical protein